MGRNGVGRGTEILTEGTSRSGKEEVKRPGRGTLEAEEESAGPRGGARAEGEENGEQNDREGRGRGETEEEDEGSEQGDR